jgi:hypothetical protein
MRIVITDKSYNLNLFHEQLAAANVTVTYCGELPNDGVEIDIDGADETAARAIAASHDHTKRSGNEQKQAEFNAKNEAHTYLQEQSQMNPQAALTIRYSTTKAMIDVEPLLTIEVANRMADEAVLRGIPVDETTDQGKALYLYIIQQMNP